MGKGAADAAAQRRGKGCFGRLHREKGKNTNPKGCAEADLGQKHVINGAAKAGENSACKSAQSTEKKGAALLAGEKGGDKGTEEIAP